MDEFWKQIIAALATAIVAGIIAMLHKQKKILKSVEVLPSIIESLESVSRNVVVQNTSSRHIIKAMRSHSYAFREMGCNGSVTKALEHIDNAEDAINGRADVNTEESMKVQGMAI
jgi:hypothetical protein